MGNRIQSALRTPVVTFLVVLLSFWSLVGFGAWGLARTQYQHRLAEIGANGHGAIRTAAQDLRERITDAVTDFTFLGNLPRLRETADAPDEAKLTRLADTLIVYAKASKNITGIRWFDASGKEQLRVNSTDHQLTRTPSAELAATLGDPMVSQLAALSPAEIHMSPMTLAPGPDGHPEPTVRMSTPVHNSTGEQQGWMVVEYQGNAWLDALPKKSSVYRGRLSLLNREGQSLNSISGPNATPLAADPTQSLAQHNPAAWRELNSADIGSWLNGDLWLWANVYPLKEIAFAQQAIDGTSAASQVMGEQEYTWRLVLLVPEADLKAVHSGIWGEIKPVLAALLFLGLLIASWVARSQWRIAKLNQALGQRADHAEALAQAKSNFLANMSHEIRTPMNAVLGLAYLLEQSKLPPDASDLVRKIRIAGRSLQGIINDILDYTKIESGHLELEHAPFRLDDVLENLATVMGATSGDKDIELVIGAHPLGINQLMGDALRIEQVLINLTNNAIKFTDHGHVLVSIQPLAQTPTHVTLRFSVRDSGIGIPPERQTELFKPFVQADASTTRRFGGTGLGLAISRRLVALMNGQMGLNSTPGQGSEFWFDLPLDVCADTTQALSDMQHLHLLIADDNPIALEAMRITASGLGWTALTANSGEEALALLQTHRNDELANAVILLDWKMPHLDGLATARRIQERMLGKEKPIVLMVTAYSREALMAENPGDAIDDVLTKPVTASGLYNAVARVQARRQGTVVDTPTHGAHHRLQGVRLLVVDDSDINREVAQRIFQGEGARVHTANDGRQALQWLDAHAQEVDLVLMDVQMPVMDGYEATHAIRANAQLAHLPVVALTAGALKSQEAAAHAAGMDNYIAKPFDVDVAVGLIAKLAHLKRPTTDPGAAPAEASNASPPRPVPTPQRQADLPGLSVDKGLVMWGDEAVFKQYLRRFADENIDTPQRMGQMEGADVAALAHKIKGSAGNLALDGVSKAAAELDRALKAGEPFADAVQALQSAMEIAWASVNTYAPPLQPTTAAPTTHTAGPVDTGAVADLLKQLLLALDADDPSVAEPSLATLEGLLGMEAIRPVRTALQGFDFRGAEAITHQLADQYPDPSTPPTT